MEFIGRHKASGANIYRENGKHYIMKGQEYVMVDELSKEELEVIEILHNNELAGINYVSCDYNSVLKERIIKAAHQTITIAITSGDENYDNAMMSGINKLLEARKKVAFDYTLCHNDDNKKVLEDLFVQYQRKINLTLFGNTE